MPLIRNNDQGFVLVAAIWLLLLCAGIAALLMLRGVDRGRQARSEGDILTSRLALENAVETVIADMLFNGPRSRWSMVPSSGAVMVGNDAIEVRLSSESGRMDLNDGDLGQIAMLLRGFGFKARERQAFLDDLIDRRKRQARLASWPEVDKLLAKLPRAQVLSSCVAREFTLYSGLSAPRPSQASLELGRVLALTASPEPSPPEPGTALRIEATVPTGANVLAVVRIIGLQDRAYSMLRWQFNPICAAR